MAAVFMRTKKEIQNKYPIEYYTRKRIVEFEKNDRVDYKFWKQTPAVLNE